MPPKVDLDKPLLDGLTYDSESGLAVPKTALYFVFICVFMDVLGGNISTPVMPYYVKSFGVGNAAVGYLFSAFMMTSIFGAPALGSLSDKFGRRPILLMSLLGAGVAAYMQGFAPSYGALFFARAFSGIWGAIMPVAQVYVADACSKEVLSEWMSYTVSVQGAATSFGPAFGGYLAQFGLNVPILVDGSCSFVIVVFAYFFLPESPAWKAGVGGKTGKGAGKGGKAGKGAGKVGKAEDSGNNAIPIAAYALGLSNFFFGMGMFSSNAMIPVVFAAKFGFDPVHVGYALTFAAIVRLFASFFLTKRIEKRLGKKYTAALGSFLCGTGLILTVSVSNMYISILALTVARIGSGTRIPMSGAIAGTITQPSNRARTFSFTNTVQNIGKLIGPVIAGHLADVEASLLPLLFSGGAILLCSFCDLVLLPSEEPEISQPHLATEAETGATERKT